uniref:Uncharacterized protein n=1 Tax=Ananas comosus var. bracteatus TaxID=296719 RepID=A0A6V7Q6G2_ANACO|nr:unnamed protein product [Ananas comosus var. bracteatus]
MRESSTLGATLQSSPPSEARAKTLSKSRRIRHRWRTAFLLEDIIAKMGERYTEMADTFNSFNENVHSMEESVATAMETFRSELEKLQANMKSRDEERKKLIEELVARVDEVEDIKTRVTILEKAVGCEPWRDDLPCGHPRGERQGPRREGPSCGDWSGLGRFPGCHAKGAAEATSI